VTLGGLRTRRAGAVAVAVAVAGAGAGGLGVAAGDIAALETESQSA